MLTGTAQVHATLALAAATAMAGGFGNRAKADARRQAADTTMTSWHRSPSRSPAGFQEDALGATRQ